MADALRRPEGGSQPPAPPWPHPHAPHCATSGLHHLHPGVCNYWAAYSDIARLPHSEYFESLPDLLRRLRSKRYDKQRHDLRKHNIVIILATKLLRMTTRQNQTRSAGCTPRDPRSCAGAAA